MPRLPLVVALVAGVLVPGLTPPPLAAQGVLPATAGGVAGTVVGTAVAAGVVVARARLSDDYLWSPRDALGWPAAVVLAGTVSGIVLGATDDEALGGAALAAAILGAGGAGLGALLGRDLFGDEGGGWAGAFMGAGLGALSGWVVGALVTGGDDPGPVGQPALVLGFQLPWGGR